MSYSKSAYKDSLKISTSTQNLDESSKWYRKKHCFMREGKYLRFFGEVYLSEEGMWWQDIITGGNYISWARMDPYNIQFGGQGLYKKEYKVTNSKLGREQANEISWNLNFIRLCVCFSRSVVSDSLWPCGLQSARLLCPWDSPGRNTGGGCHFLLQGIFLIQGLNPGLLHYSIRDNKYFL